eukprot:NODE_164_length_16443_cov_0.166544.p7 type:complete len:272 gc:universal NODE_164_length_16443_cov_0.166544:7124-6309(-)
MLFAAVFAVPSLQRGVQSGFVSPFVSLGPLTRSRHPVRTHTKYFSTVEEGSPSTVEEGSPSTVDEGAHTVPNSILNFPNLEKEAKTELKTYLEFVGRFLQVNTEVAELVVYDSTFKDLYETTMQTAEHIGVNLMDRDWSEYALVEPNDRYLSSNIWYSIDDKFEDLKRYCNDVVESVAIICVITKLRILPLSDYHRHHGIADAIKEYVDRNRKGPVENNRAYWTAENIERWNLIRLNFRRMAISNYESFLTLRRFLEGFLGVNEEDARRYL